jgi:hypothetical protein
VAIIEHEQAGLQPPLSFTAAPTGGHNWSPENGEVITAFQAARQTRDNREDLQEVDEQLHAQYLTVPYLGNDIEAADDLDRDI